MNEKATDFDYGYDATSFDNLPNDYFYNREINHSRGVL
jgi:hypothetical protein